MATTQSTDTIPTVIYVACKLFGAYPNTSNIGNPNTTAGMFCNTRLFAAGVRESKPLKIE